MQSWDEQIETVLMTWVAALRRLQSRRKKQYPN